MNADEKRRQQNARTKRWREAHPERRKAWLQRWREANPEKVRAQRLRRKGLHGLSPNDIQTRLADQQGRCAICRTNETSGRGWHGDHDHASGIFRAVLCHRCNLLLGQARDNPETCRAAAEYIERYSALASLL